MKSLVKVVFAASIVILTIGLGLAYSVISYGFVGMCLWKWFVAAKFGLPYLTITEAWGLSILASLWTYNPILPPDDDKISNYKKYGHIIGKLLLPWFLLFVAWIVLTISTVM